MRATQRSNRSCRSRRSALSQAMMFLISSPRSHRWTRTLHGPVRLAHLQAAEQRRVVVERLHKPLGAISFFELENDKFDKMEIINTIT